jgi:hypothetical protein
MRSTYVGKTENGPATLQLTQDDSGSVTGTLTIDGDMLTLEGRVASAGRVVGTASVQGMGMPLPFEMSRQGDALRFSLRLDGEAAAESIVFRAPSSGSPTPARPGGAGDGEDLARTSGGTAATSNASGSASLAGGGMYRFPTGLGFRYPTGWTIQEAPGGDVLLMPPDASPQLEGYQVLTPQFNDAIAQAGLRGDDPRLGGVADSLMQRLVPGLRRVGAPEAATAGGQPGSIYTYEGIGANGMPARARVRIAIHDNSLFGILAVGEKDKVVARDGTIQAVFESFATGAAAIDPQLVGTWMGGVHDNGKILQGVGGRTTGTTASDSQTRHVLSADGTLTEITRYRTIVNMPGISLDTGDHEDMKTGRWSAANGRLSITLNGSTVSCPYRIQGNTLTLTMPDGSTSTAYRVQ